MASFRTIAVWAGDFGPIENFDKHSKTYAYVSFCKVSARYVKTLFSVCLVRSQLYSIDICSNYIH